ncbi:accessory factor UbiK family protein [Hyphobacterium sp. CCMP332]|jgi:BMFP domain-containing protein YqiC|uniref:accessory factor UbiK family protein n=1 Tax=Hyphobacterium sp. CCMP332 TaxID=2749086 RepID=UPI00164FEE3C|nr:accessory factor UbiK family protein [Hyphobacterium sp. CCMP332]QNL18167.1 accessory factor UbiK family protein [Hyphobacterium sp. CCMP332]
MQTRNPLLNDFAELMTDAFSAAQAAGEEAQTVFRAQADKMAARMDFVSREEFDAVKAVAQAARDEADALKVRIEALEKAATKPVAKTASARKPAAKKSTAKKPASGKK